MSSSEKVKELFWRSNSMEEADNSGVQTKLRLYPPTCRQTAQMTLKIG
ncbi:unnamed protein product [Musa acuminata subsp. burmannicoides]